MSVETMAAFVRKQKKLQHENRVLFQRIFGDSIDKYWDGLIGFDVVKFDHEYLEARHGDYMDGKTSMKDMVRDNYGTDGVDLIERLIA